MTPTVCVYYYVTVGGSISKAYPVVGAATPTPCNDYVVCAFYLSHWSRSHVLPTLSLEIAIYINKKFSFFI